MSGLKNDFLFWFCFWKVHLISFCTLYMCACVWGYAWLYIKYEWTWNRFFYSRVLKSGLEWSCEWSDFLHHNSTTPNLPLRPIQPSVRRAVQKRNNSRETLLLASFICHLRARMSFSFCHWSLTVRHDFSSSAGCLLDLFFFCLPCLLFEF